MNFINILSDAINSSIKKLLMVVIPLPPRYRNKLVPEYFALTQ